MQHCGVQSTFGELRSRFWVPKGRQYAKKVLRECETCKREHGKPSVSQPVAALPDFRVRETTPTWEMAKSYIAQFTCCVTRAVDLDHVTDPTARTFVRCLQRFAARRGTPSLVVSDDAKTFKASEKLLRRHFVTTKKQESIYRVTESTWGLIWSGHLGGVAFTRAWSKRCLRKVLGNARLNADELLTVLMELEATLNSRPLTYEYDELGADMLTPTHLIYIWAPIVKSARVEERGRREWDKFT